MQFIQLIYNNILNPPLICFLLGIVCALKKTNHPFLKELSNFLIIYILFCIGLKGGGPLAEHFNSCALLFSVLVTALVIWGLVHPVLSFFLLKSSTRIDLVTAAAIAASFGSVSVMTFITGTSFLDQLHIDYQKLAIPSAAIMEVPAIISGIFLAKRFNKTESTPPKKILKLIQESVLNKAILSIFLGLIIGVIFYSLHLDGLTQKILWSFKPLLCLFLFEMGVSVGLQRHHFRSFSWTLNLFGIYMPLIGGSFGLLLSYFLGLDVGTGTLIAILTASASYIAVPAAMRIALPEAKEAIYLPLSLGITFPFNIVIGIPTYYYLARVILSV